MGSTISVCNLSAVIINVALRHASPLYYYNQLDPYNCTIFRTGKVWFTVEAKVWMNGTNDYTNAQVGLPIASAALIAPVLGGFLTVLGVAESSRWDEDPDESTPPPVFVPHGNDSWKLVPFPTVEPERIHEFVLGVTGVVAAVAASPGLAVGIAGAVVNTEKTTPKDWKVQKTGVFMDAEKKIFIIGGPQPSSVKFGIKNCKKYQYINETYQSSPFVIVEVSKSG